MAIDESNEKDKYTERKEGLGLCGADPEPDIYYNEPIVPHPEPEPEPDNNNNDEEQE